jgi:sporulation related protein
MKNGDDEHMNERDGRHGDLPVFPSSWDADNLDFPAGGDFEAEIEELVLQGELEDSLDEAMTGKSSPRVWLLLHEPGQGPLSAIVALYFARELGARDQGVLILDCEEEDPTLTRWAGRVGGEGWADMVRYGASVLTSGISLPFTGRQGYLLGPGSYSPVDIQPNEIDQILSRLRRQADDIILVCPLGEAGRWWAPNAEIRILCWNAPATSVERIETIVDGLDRSETPLTGLVRFGPEPEAVESTEPSASAGDATEISEPTEPTEPADSGTAPTPAATEVPPIPDYARKRGTSRVFWWVALAAIGLIAVSAWYYFEYVREPVLDRVPGSGSPVAVVDQEPEMESGLGVADRDSLVTAAPDSLTLAGDMALADPGGRDTASDEVVAEVAAEIVAADGPNTDPQIEPMAEPEAPAEAQFFMDPYLIPVGSDGWALHVYSFPDEEGAVDQLEILKRKGFVTETRAVQIKDKGRWHRIYLGSFMTRAAAQEALDPLLKELGQDWGRPTEF